MANLSSLRWYSWHAGIFGLCEMVKFSEMKDLVLIGGGVLLSMTFRSLPIDLKLDIEMNCLDGFPTYLLKVIIVLLFLSLLAMYICKYCLCL